ncbi:MAG: EamA family transporter [Sandaracinaceae bacterium]
MRSPLAGTAAMGTASMGTVMIVCAATAWGTWSLFLRPTGLPATVTAPLLLLGIFVFAVPFFRFDGVEPRWDRRTLALLLAYAALDALNVGTFFAAMGVTSVAVAVLTHSVAPVLVALLAPHIEKRPTPRALPAAGLALVGLCLLLRPWEPAALTGQLGLGAALGLTSAVGYAALVFLVGPLSARIGPARTMGWHALPAALLLAPFAVADLGQVELRDVGWMAVAALVPGVLAGVAFVRGLALVGAARAAVLAFVEPVVACLVGWVWFGERLPPVALLGALLVLCAGFMVSARRRPSSGISL